MASHAFRLIGKEKRRAANGLKKHFVMNGSAGLWRAADFGIQVKPASLLAGTERRWFMWFIEPALAVKLGQCHPAPVHSLSGYDASIDGDAHDHRAVLLDFADFAKFHVVAEAGNHGRLHVEAGHVAAAKTRQNEKNDGAHHERSERDPGGGEAQRIVQLICGNRAGFHGARDRSFRASPHFQAYEG